MHGKIVMMVGTLLIKRGIILLLSLIYIQLVGIMVIQMFLLGNMIMIMVRLWIKIYGLCNN